ncbi:peptidase M4 family protein [Bacillus cereus]|nr:peptidase M4 family protein [Bacillus cereus]
MCQNHKGAKCSFIPPSILAHMARAGVDGSQMSIKESKDSRTKRKQKTIHVTELEAGFTDNTTVSLQSTGGSRREIYDCQNQWVQRIKLVRSEGEPDTQDDIVNKVYEYSGIVRDYFKNVLNRDSIDNRGLDLILNVHYGTNFLNAFWDGDEMTFGDGDGNIFINFANSKDVIGHELAHGVTQYTANLEYSCQSGALNEHFSDVFGTAIKQHSNGQTAHDADWLIGNDIMGPSLFGEALRSMKAPGTAFDNPLMGTDPQPDHMKNYYDGCSDNNGVHINSGIFNRVFYLVSMEIGTDKAAKLWYQALQNLWPTANFKDAVKVLVRIAQILTKNGDVPFGTTQTVRSAFREVGL